MKISINWLNNYVDIKIPPEKLAYILNMAGFGVEKTTVIDGDTVFELEITPNRPDCLSYIGIAREVAAALSKPLKIPAIKSIKKAGMKTGITILDKKGCSRYIGAVIKGINVKESPAWLREKLNAIETRSINNVVDITNFCLMEFGQPLHAFDYDKLSGGKIHVRRAKEGETLITIDGEERKLDPSILVIADDKGPVAIAGIMGGKETEVTAETKNILLESAYFDPVLIRLAGRKLGLSSDSSYRFERGVQFESVAAGAQRAISLTLELAGGQLERYCDRKANVPSIPRKSVTISKDFLEERLGAVVPLTNAKNILIRLGCKVTSSQNSLKILPAPFRGDIKLGADIVEEIARVLGYDKLPATLPQIKASEVPVSKKRLFRKSLFQALLSLGFNEIVTYSMTNQKNLDRSNMVFTEVMRVKNPLSQDQELMRPSLLPNFLTVISSNLNRGQKDLRLFETGKIYGSSGEKEVFALTMTGSRLQDWRRAQKEEVNFFDLKGALERLLERTDIAKYSFIPVEKPFLENAQSAAIMVDGQEIGYIGKISSIVLDRWDIRAKNILFAQLDVEALFDHAAKQKHFEPVPEYPSIIRDISLAIKKDVTFQQIEEIVMTSGTKFLSSIKMIEEYMGDKIPQGYRGLVFSLTFRSAERTLREEEVAQIHARICQVLADKLGAIKR